MPKLEVQFDALGTKLSTLIESLIQQVAQMQECHDESVEFLECRLSAIDSKMDVQLERMREVMAKFQLRRRLRFILFPPAL